MRFELCKHNETASGFCSIRLIFMAWYRSHLVRKMDAELDFDFVYEVTEVLALAMAVAHRFVKAKIADPFWVQAISGMTISGTYFVTDRCAARESGEFPLHSVCSSVLPFLWTLR